MKEMCNEMIKLRARLNVLGIKWEDKSDSQEIRKVIYEIHCQIHEELEDIFDDSTVIGDVHDYGIDRTHFEVNGTNFSCINGRFTYGGFDEYKAPDNQGLLEVMVEGGSVEGYLTCEEVIKMVESCMKKED